MSEQSGLIFAYVLDGNGGGRIIDWEGLKQWSTDQGTLWLHLDYESEKVHKWLNEQSGLDSILNRSIVIKMSLK